MVRPQMAVQRSRLIGDVEWETFISATAAAFVAGLGVSVGFKELVFVDIGLPATFRFE